MNARIQPPHRLNPFDLKDIRGFERWCEWKLANAPQTLDDILVEVRDPRALSATERSAMLECIRRTNMVIYASPALDEDPNIPRSLGRQFGLRDLDANWLAGEDGITSLTVSEGGTRQAYIPYTNRPIKWHTDGYYNPPTRTIRAMILHCVHSAAAGGENRLLDHELAYLLLRRQDPAFIHALMQADAMVIPKRVDEHDGIRPEQPGPVFSIDAQSGALHMRYTARTRSIEWKQDAQTAAAVKALETLLASDLPYILQARLEPGMGLLCNNVLHDRSGFHDDDGHNRLLYRARYYNRISDSLSLPDPDS